jgi:hypothetical protein
MDEQQLILEAYAFAVYQWQLQEIKRLLDGESTRKEEPIGIINYYGNSKT